MTRLEFSTIIKQEVRPLKGYAYQLTHNLEDANDLLQETMLKAFSYRMRFMEGTNLKSWLYTIMRNSFINNYRRRIKRNTFIESTETAYLVDTSLNAVENTGERAWLRKDIQMAMESLPNDLKKTFTMNYKGFKYHEIAEILHIPIGTVKTRIFVARKILRKKLSVYGMELGTQEKGNCRIQ